MTLAKKSNLAVVLHVFCLISLVEIWLYGQGSEDLHISDHIATIMD